VNRKLENRELETDIPVPGLRFPVHCLPFAHSPRYSLDSLS
jgi:hypothetical protein